jgi:hypothetical protein
MTFSTDGFLIGIGIVATLRIIIDILIKIIFRIMK